MHKKIFLCTIFCAVSALAMESNQLERVILEKVNGSDSQFLAFVHRTYPEMRRLTEPVKASPEAQMVFYEDSPSKLLFGKQHIEFDRTAVGILSLKWVISNDYKKFVQAQPAAVKLKPESFAELREFTTAIIEKNRLNALLTSLAINDLGKVISFVKEVEERTQSQDIDHDNILLTALRKYPQLVPSFGKLSKDDQDIILKGMSAQFNLGQFVQAENLPANLKGLKGLCVDELHFNNVHTVFDVAGARGHISSQGSLVINEPTHQFFTKAFKALVGLAQGRSLTEVYNHYLDLRASAFDINIATPPDRALMRVTCMARCETNEQFNQVKTVFGDLPKSKQDRLITELNKDGINDHAFLLYYAPAILVNACNADSKKGLITGLEFMVSIMEEATACTDIEGIKKPGVFTIDCAAVAEKMKTPSMLSHYKLRVISVNQDFKAVMEEKK